MKNFIKVLVVALCTLLLVGCSSKEKNVITTCTLNSDQSASGYTLSSTYKIYSTNNAVTKVETTEIVTSDNETIRDYFVSALENSYKTAEETYGGYTYKVIDEYDKVTSTVTIDYTKMDLNKFIKDNSSMKSYVNKDNKITLEGAKNIYETLGATCK